MFKPSIGISVFNRLGTKLYRKVESAISETIANAYDANANNCWIYYDSNKPTKFIAIIDNGRGMNLGEMQGNFMKIAESVKKDAVPDIKRVQMGSKGIGKLAPLFYAAYYDVYSKGSDGKIHGFRFTNNIKHMDTNGKNFKEMKYDELDDKFKFLDDLETGTMILPGEFIKQTPFSKNKIDVFVHRIRDNFCVPQDNNFKIQLININNKREMKALNGSLKEPVIPDKIFKIYKTKEVSIINRENLLIEEMPNKITLSSGEAMFLKGYFGVYESIEGLTGEVDKPKIKIYAHGRLVSNNLPQNHTNSRTLGVSYVSGVIEIDDLSNKAKNDIISDNREDFNWGEDEDERVFALKRYLKNKISKGISDFQANSTTKKKQRASEEIQKFKENGETIKNILIDENIDDENLDKIINLLSQSGPIDQRKHKSLIISHNYDESSKIANFLLNFLLFLGLEEGKNVETILNTSSTHYGLKYGESFIERLKKTTLINHALVLYCLGPNFFESWFTSFEAGVSFGLGENVKIHKVLNHNMLNILKPPFDTAQTIPHMKEIISDKILDDILKNKDLSPTNDLQLNYFLQMIQEICVFFGLKYLIKDLNIQLLDFIQTYEKEIFSNHFSTLKNSLENI